jgi:hypothetical protein
MKELEKQLNEILRKTECETTFTNAVHRHVQHEGLENTTAYDFVQIMQDILTDNKIMTPTVKGEIMKCIDKAIIEAGKKEKLAKFNAGETMDS